MLTALIVPVPRVAPMVDDWRERTCQYKPSMGVPAHVTVLFPFVPAEQVDNGLLEELEGFFARHEPFGVTFPRLARFPTVLYLDPEPAGPFVELMRAIAERWPEHHPYESEHGGSVIPHLTVAQGEPALLDVAEAELAPRLPLTSRVTEVTLLVEIERFGELWEPRASFVLGG